MNALRALILAVLLAGCETSGHLVTYGSLGTTIQAERLVAVVYGRSTQPLPYGADVGRPLKRIQARWPQLRAELEKGTVGLTETGYLQVREPAGRANELARLVRAENLDRHLLYQSMTEAVGYGGETQVIYQPYTEDAFGAEWVKQAPPGWWILNEEQVWRRKATGHDDPRR